MEIITTDITDVKLIKPRVFADDRGYFLESWNEETFAKLGLDLTFRQDNESFSSQGTLRGIHFQHRRPQGKLVRVIQGEVFDIAVDLRQNSATFGQWVGERLSSDNKHMLWIPPGFGHAFYVLSETATFVYKCTDVYVGDDQHTLNWDDKDVNVKWPAIEGIEEPNLSEKDLDGLSLKDYQNTLLSSAPSA